MRVNKATDTVAGHLFSCPNVFCKTPEGQWLLDSHASSSNSNISKFSLQFVEEKYDMSDLEVHLNKDSSLRKALDTGVLMDRSYVQTIESTLDEVPEKRFPILRDPTLVRAAQLADLDLLQKAKKDHLHSSEWLVKQYYGLLLKFNELLNARLNRINCK